MLDFKESFENFAAQRLTKAYREFRNTDLEYQEIECYLNKHSKRFDEILNSLCEEDKKFTEDYISKQSYEASCANENFYIAGYEKYLENQRNMRIT